MKLLFILTLTVSCSSTPKFLPQEVIVAKEELGIANGEGVERRFPSSMQRARLEIDEAVRFSRAANDNQPTERKAELENAAIEKAARARRIIEKSREADELLRDWDDDILLADYQSEAEERFVAGEEDLQVVQPLPLPLAYFSKGSTQLNEEAKQRISKIAAFMVTNDDQHVVLKGRVDYSKDKIGNRSRSLARLSAVRAYLIEKGVDSERIEIGETILVKTHAGAIVDRRVEAEFLELAH